MFCKQCKKEVKKLYSSKNICFNCIISERIKEQKIVKIKEFELPDILCNSYEKTK